MQHIQILKATAAKHAGRAALMSVCPIDLAIYLLACIKIILRFVCIEIVSKCSLELTRCMKRIYLCNLENGISTVLKNGF